MGLTSTELALRQAEYDVRAEVMKASAAWKSADAIARRFETSVVKKNREHYADRRSSHIKKAQWACWT